MGLNGGDKVMVIQLTEEDENWLHTMRQWKKDEEKEKEKLKNEEKRLREDRKD